MRRGKTGIHWTIVSSILWDWSAAWRSFSFSGLGASSALPLVQMSWKFESRLKQLPRLKGFPPACPINSISILRIFAERENGGSPNRDSSPYCNSKFLLLHAAGVRRRAFFDQRFYAVWAEDLPSLPRRLANSNGATQTNSPRANMLWGVAAGCRGRRRGRGPLG